MYRFYIELVDVPSLDAKVRYCRLEQRCWCEEKFLCQPWRGAVYFSFPNLNLCFLGGRVRPRHPLLTASPQLGWKCQNSYRICWLQFIFWTFFRCVSNDRIPSFRARVTGICSILWWSLYLGKGWDSAGEVDYCGFCLFCTTHWGDLSIPDKTESLKTQVLVALCLPHRDYSVQKVSAPEESTQQDS